MPIANVAIAGGSGTLGSVVLQELVKSGFFQVTVLARTSSKATFPDSVRTVKVPDDYNVAAVTDLLRGQHALVVTLPGHEYESAVRLAEAAAAAGVGRFIAPDFGSGDSTDKHAQQIFHGYAVKARVRERLAQLVAEHAGFSWTSIINGHFFDYGITTGFFKIDLKERKMDLFDNGTARWSTTTLSKIGQAVVQVLRRPEVTKNKVLYIQSFVLSQLDILEALKRATGGEWTVTRYELQPLLEERQRQAAAGDPTQDVVLLHGIQNSNWENKDGLAMDLLGLEPDDLDETVQRIVEESKANTK